jgi:hypothetical protein
MRLRQVLRHPGVPAMTESTLYPKLQLLATQLGARLFRNNVAKAVVGDVEFVRRSRFAHLHPGDCIVRNARVLHAGLAAGSADLIGWTPTIVQGESVAVFTSVEVKHERGGRITQEQLAWRNTVNDAGGLAMIVRSEREYEDAVRAAL